MNLTRSNDLSEAGGARQKQILYNLKYLKNINKSVAIPFTVRILF